jgi:3-phenylpropionate/trans-cinnamate dioxygenase ferredoxin reductase subunit
MPVEYRRLRAIRGFSHAGTLPTVTEERTFVVVGANLAGGRAVETLRAEGFEGRIVLVGDEPDRPYERPPLSKELLRGEDTPLFLRDEAFYDDIDLRLGVRATKLDPSGSLTLEDGEEIAFDACLLATGGRPRTLDGVDGSYLRTLRDCLALREKLASKPNVVVIGAGFIGAEVAASARTMGCDVTMLEVLDVPLLRVLGPELGRAYAEIHRDHGVDLRLGYDISTHEFSPDDVVVIGVGIVPNVELAADAGIECDNGILVDEFCRTSAPKVFAAGDVAHTRGTLRIEHFQNAQNQGAAAARSMLGAGSAFHEVPWFWSDQYDVNLQILGLPSGEPVVRGSLDERDFVAFYLDGPYLTAATAMNRGKEIAIARRLIERRIEVDAGQLRDEDVALRSLLR